MNAVDDSCVSSKQVWPQFAYRLRHVRCRWYWFAEDEVLACSVRGLIMPRVDQAASAPDDQQAPCWAGVHCVKASLDIAESTGDLRSFQTVHRVVLVKERDVKGSLRARARQCCQRRLTIRLLRDERVWRNVLELAAEDQTVQPHVVSNQHANGSPTNQCAFARGLRRDGWRRCCR